MVAVMQGQIVEQARALLGVKFHHQGRSAQTGLDCLGLLVVVASSCGLVLDGKPADAHDHTDYGHNPDTAFLEASLARLLAPVDEYMSGDVVLFHINKRPQHLAIVSDHPAAGEYGMIHAYAPLRKVVEHRLDERWKSQLHRAYRWIRN